MNTPEPLSSKYLNSSSHSHNSYIRLSDRQCLEVIKKNNTVLRKCMVIFSQRLLLNFQCFSNFYLIHELPDPGKDTSAVGAREPDVANFVLKFWQMESFGQTVTDIPVSFNATLKCTFLI